MFGLMAEAGALIRAHDELERERLWSAATDDLHDAIVAPRSADELLVAFTDAAREFWLRENAMHSRKAPPLLTVIKGDAA